MTPEQQAVLDRVRERVKERVQLESQLNRLDTADDQAILADKRQAALDRVRSQKQELSQPVPKQKQEPDSILDDILDVGGEFARGANRSVADVADLVTSPVRGISNLGAWVAGTDKRMLSFNQLLDALPGGTGEMMEDGLAKDAVAALGYTFPVAASLLPVPRNIGAAESVVQDILGLGNSTLTQNQKMAETTAQALKNMDLIQLGKETLTDPDEIFEAAYNLGQKQVIEKNRPFLEEAERLSVDRAKDLAKFGASDVELPKGVTQVSLRQIQDDMYALYGVDPNETLKAIRKNKGLTYSDDILEMAEADKIFKQDGTGKDINWYDRTFLPVADVLRKYVSAGVGGRFERAFETATRNVTRITEDLGKPIEKVIRVLDNDLDLKRLFLDVGRNPDLMPEIRRRIRLSAGEDGLAEFNRFVSMSGNRQSEALQRLFKQDSGFDDVYFFHTQKKPEAGAVKPGMGVDFFEGARGRKPESLKLRTRKAASTMDDAEVAMYENPLATHLQYLAEQEILLEIAKKFGLRPSLVKGSNVTELFSEVAMRLQRDGFDENVANTAANLMLKTYEGSRASPPAAVRGFMSLAYAGTLAQVKTAVLNLHDIAVAMFNQGVRPTLKALVQSNNGQFGKTLNQLGIGDNQSVGEFVQNFDKFQSNPSAMDRMARASRNVSDFSMFISGFKYMDRVGKGVVLRATLNNARRSAQAGTLAKDFGHLMDRDELIRIRPYLQKGTPAKDIPKDIAEKIEQLAFTGLGEQQLISVAGRPLNYLRMPVARPLYALTGFAIKQQALLRRKVGEEWLAGNYAEAGKNAAAYAAFAGLGYGILHEGRESVGKREQFNAEDILVNAVDQIAAAATLNKLGDDYGRDAFLEDPVGFLMESFIPPTGFAGAAAEDVADMIFKGEYNAKVAERLPLVGDFYKYYWKD